MAYVALAVGYLRLTPPWENPDEPAHFNYVAYVATTGGLPVLQAGDWDSALLSRVQNGTLLPTDDLGAIRYESWQPPLFYLVAAPVYRFGPADSALYRLRALDLVFGAATLLLAYWIARDVLPPMLAASVPLTMAGIPMFTAVSASLSADPLANLLAAVILLALLRNWRPLLVGILLGLGLLTKLELAIFVPLVLAVIALRSSSKLRDCAIVLAATFAVMSPWLVHQVTSYGWADPFAITRHASVVTDQPRFPGLSLEWLAQFATISFHSFWAQFGWMAVVAPDRLYWLWAVIPLAALVGLLLTFRPAADEAWRVLLATIALAFVAYVGYNLNFVQYQSRYLFTALVPISILLVRGWSALPPRPWLALALPALLIVLNAYALERVLIPGFAPPA